jgi:hypothetical protein
MSVLPGVLGCRPLRRTVQVRKPIPRDAGRLPGGPPASPERAGSRWRAGTPILFALAPLRSVPQAGSQFRGLATATHEISGLSELNQLMLSRWPVSAGFFYLKSKIWSLGPVYVRFMISDCRLQIEVHAFLTGKY